MFCSMTKLSVLRELILSLLKFTTRHFLLISFSDHCLSFLFSLLTKKTCLQQMNYTLDNLFGEHYSNVICLCLILNLFLVFVNNWETYILIGITVRDLFHDWEICNMASTEYEVSMQEKVRKNVYGAINM